MTSQVELSKPSIRTVLLSICLSVGIVPRPTYASEPHYDVVVVSGSSGGFAAALAAGRMGMSVALVEDTPVLGGMLSNSLWHFDTASCESVSGIADEFRRNVKNYYTPSMSRDPTFEQSQPQEPKEYLPIGWPWTLTRCADPREGGAWEPHVADFIFKQMMSKVPRIHVFYDTYATGVIMHGERIIGVLTRTTAGQSQRLFGSIVIDATPEGDVAAWAGVPYRIGREARSKLEPHAGQIYFLDETGEIMPGSSGSQDRAIPSYGLWLTVRVYGKEGAAPKVNKPLGYRAAEYAQAGCMKGPWTPVPHEKFTMIANPIGNEMQGINWTWPEGTHAQRVRLYQIYKSHALGFLYFQQHDCGLSRIGLPKDEFVGNGNVPYRLYVREGRRIVGMSTMTEADVNPFIAGHGLIPPLHPDSIAIGYYPIDSKPDMPKTDFSRPDKGSGDFFLVNAASAFQVPYGAIVPQKIDGLLVPVAISATHVAYSAIRMEPTFMAMGQAAGTAAALSIRDGLDVRELPVAVLQRELIRQKCRLAFYWDVSVEAPSFAAIQWLSLRGVVEGYRDRFFRPGRPITRAELASWMVKALRLWPSVSNDHFSDVSYDDPSFRAIETLFDNNLLQAFGIEAKWPKVGGFSPMRNIGFAQAHGSFGKFFPTRPVLWPEFMAMLRLASSRDPDMLRSGHVTYTTGDLEELHHDATGPVTRGEAAIVLYSLLGARRGTMSTDQTSP